MKLIYGVGINDADYNVYVCKRVDGVIKVLWICPFYKKWKDMLKRIYCNTYKKSFPSYSECCVVSEWYSFMNFKAWMEKQDWEGKCLDKDILFPGNNVYGPDTCIFIDHRTNSFILECQKIRGEHPIGVSFHKASKKYLARCRDVVSGKSKYLGSYGNEIEAHQAWLTFKLEQAKIIASEQSDPRVAAALIDRYENYGANQ